MEVKTICKLWALKLRHWTARSEGLPQTNYLKSHCSDSAVSCSENTGVGGRSGAELLQNLLSMSDFILFYSGWLMTYLSLFFRRENSTHVKKIYNGLNRFPAIKLHFYSVCLASPRKTIVWSRSFHFLASDIIVSEIYLLFLYGKILKETLPSNEYEDPSWVYLLQLLKIASLSSERFVCTRSTNNRRIFLIFIYLYIFFLFFIYTTVIVCDRTIHCAEEWQHSEANPNNSSAQAFLVNKFK